MIEASNSGQHAVSEDEAHEEDLDKFGIKVGHRAGVEGLF